MNYHDDHKKQQERNSQLNARLKNADELYVFDTDSGIYKPKGTQSQERRSTDQRGKDWKSALRIYPASDGCMLSLAVFGALVSFATLIVIALYTYYASGQWTEMQKATLAAKKSADIADATLKSTEKSFIINQRPYMVTEKGEKSGGPVFTERPAPGKIIEVNQTLKNVGRTPAVKIWLDTKLLLYPPRDVPVAQSGAYYRKFITSAFVEIQQRSQRARKELSQLSTLAGGQDVPPDGTFFFTTHNGLVLSPAELEDVMSEGQAPHRILLVITFVSYTDSYGGDYTTETCAQFWGNNDFKIWHICDAFNVIR